MRPDNLQPIPVPQIRDSLSETTRKLVTLLQRRKHYSREKAMLLACMVPPAKRGVVFMRLLRSKV